MSETWNFSVRVNDGPERTITVPCSIYRDAAAAAIAMTGSHVPCAIEIWVPFLLPEYGPYHYLAEEDEFGGLRIRHAVKTRPQ